MIPLLPMKILNTPLVSQRRLFSLDSNSNNVDHLDWGLPACFNVTHVEYRDGTWFPHHNCHFPCSFSHRYDVVVYSFACLWSISRIHSRIKSTYSKKNEYCSDDDACSVRRQVPTWHRFPSDEDDILRTGWGPNHFCPHWESNPRILDCHAANDTTHLQGKQLGYRCRMTEWLFPPPPGFWGISQD